MTFALVPDSVPPGTRIGDRYRIAGRLGVGGMGEVYRADVTPKPSIHVYAAGAADFVPVTIVLTPNPAISMGQLSRVPQV